MAREELFAQEGGCPVLRLLTAVVLAFAPAPSKPTFTPLDLKPHVNQKLKEPFHGDIRAGNNLASLPTGKQTFGGVTFTLGDGVVQLGSARVRGPAKVEVKVGRRLKRLHLLHSCGCGAADPVGTVIGRYVVRYDDKTEEEVEIAYGKDVVDWWVLPGQKDASRSKVGWEGVNEAAKGLKAKIKLSLTTWKNPHPGKKVVRIDYVAATPQRQAAPFCVAVTAEG
jgi:hypothetical protein